MKQANLENIYSEIMLLSDTDRQKLYSRMQKELYQNNEIVAYTTSGMPLTREQYIEKIEKAIAEANRGELITDEELEKEIATW